MKLAVLALDFDGTISEDGTIDSTVRAALHEARAVGVSIVLVTGRRIDDLRACAGELGCFDALVAENGALLVFPASGRTLQLASAPPSAFLSALTAARVAFVHGASVVEMDANSAAVAVGLVRKLELPLVPIFNRGRLMILPQGVSKATGLHEALRAMRLSEHNAVAIGDAENDHALLAACEIGAAVAWGSRVLQAAADVVVPGDGPHAIGAYLRRLVAARDLPMAGSLRHALLLGRRSDGGDLWLAVRGRNVLIVGGARTGKSYLAGLLIEQLVLQHYSVCAVDPEGDYAPLGVLPGVIVFGGRVALPSPEQAVAMLRYPDVSAVLDLSKLTSDEKRAYVDDLLPQLAELRRDRGLPHRVLIDEAHSFLTQASVRALLDLEAGGYTMVSYRVAELHPDILATQPVVLVSRLADPGAVRTLTRHATGVDQVDWAELPNLAAGEAVLLPPAPEAGGRPRRFTIAERLTAHVRHREKYADVIVSDGKAFVFTAEGRPSGPRARTLRQLADGIACAAPSSLDGHVRRGDFARWVADIPGDEVLAATLRRLQDEHDPRSIEATRDRIVAALRARYAEAADHPRSDLGIPARPTRPRSGAEPRWAS